MYIDKLLQQDFNEETKASIFNSINIATKAFARFKAENRDFFNFTPKNKTIDGYLLTYAVEKQLSAAFNTPTGNFITTYKPVNNFRYNALILKTENFICNVGRSKKEYHLLPRSKYRKEYALLNSDAVGTQLILEPTINSGKPELAVKQERHYVQLTYFYNYEQDKLVHVGLIVPNSSYTSSLYYLNLLLDTDTYIHYISPQTEEEEIVALKSSLLEEMKNKAQ